MQRALWNADGLVVEDADPGPLADGWARLRVEACGICGTDLHLADGQLDRPLGTVPGHEFVGTLLEAPAGTPDVRYAASPVVVCGTCEHCLADELNLCRRGGDLIGIGRDGGLASWVDVPVTNLVALSADVGPGVGVLAEPMAVAVRGVGLARLRADETVIVLGAGTIGLLAALVARSSNDRVVVSARYPQQVNGRDILPAEGMSMLPAMRGEPTGARTLCWEHEGNRAVRDQWWKLVGLHGKTWELYDLRADRSEMHDLATKEPERVKELAAKYDEWAKRCNVLPWPVAKKGGGR